VERNSRLDATPYSHCESRGEELVKRNCAELAYCEDIAISTKHFTFSKLPVFSTKVTERFKINPDPIGKDGGATRHHFSLWRIRACVTSMQSSDLDGWARPALPPSASPMLLAPFRSGPTHVV
jgi:hypothetical protein